MSNKMWVDKYRPKSMSDVEGLDVFLKQVVSYLNTFSKGVKPLLLTGLPGVGKTSLVYAVAGDMNYDIFELNASDVRNKSAIIDKLSKAIFQGSLFGNKKIILLEEIDGLSSMKDRGGLSEVIKLVPKSRFPIIMTANDPWDKKFSKLRSKVKIISIDKAVSDSIFNVLKRIVKNENIIVDDSVLKAISLRNDGDFRGAINDLQVLSSGTKKITKDDMSVLGDRSREQTVLEALAKIFKTRNLEVALNSFENVDINFDDQFLWLEENIAKEYLLKEDLFNAYNILSRADVFRGRIRRWQYWRFLVYINVLLTGGIALSKKERYKKFVTYSRNTRILKIWLANQSNLRRKSIAFKIAEKTHSSSSMINSNFLEYKNLLKNNPYLFDLFELDDADIKLINS